DDVAAEGIADDAESLVSRGDKPGRGWPDHVAFGKLGGREGPQFGGELPDLVPVEAAILVAVALLDEVVHSLGQLVLCDLAVLVLVKRHDPFDHVIHTKRNRQTG